jgi:hypothetical protein
MNSEWRAANGNPFASRNSLFAKARNEPQRPSAGVAPTFWSPQGKNETFGGETPTDAMRILPWRRPRPRLKREAHDCRRSTAVLAPRSLSPQGPQPQAMLPRTRPLRLTGFPRPCLSQSSECTSRPGPSAEGLMPKAARERVATPRAGTALARAGPRPIGRGTKSKVTRTVTNVNTTETRNFVI